jgi:hypothetical protein
MATVTLSANQIIRDGSSAYLVPSRSVEGAMHSVRLNPESGDCTGCAYRRMCAHLPSVIALYQDTEVSRWQHARMKAGKPRASVQVDQRRPAKTRCERDGWPGARGPPARRRG